jgi:holo-[acyl-carrier protein] synthase
VTITGTFSWIEVGPPAGAAAGVVRAGVDRVELDEFRRTVEVAGNAFVERICTPAEIAHCAGRVDRLATRFAAKEAVSKMLGTGKRGLSWDEIEVMTSAHGEPHLVLHDRARDRADTLGVTSIGISMTHTTVAAEAFVVALCTVPEAEQRSEEEETGHVRPDA